MKALTLATLLLFAVPTAPSLAQESTREDFDSFCETIQGRWVGEVTWVTDFPGLGKRGEKVTAYSDCKTTEDGNAIIVKGYAGEGSTTWLIVFDAGARRIKSLWVSSGGTVTDSILYKENGKWVEKGSGSNPDGTQIEFASKLTITDDGDTHLWTGVMTVGGKKVDEQRDVWRRAAK